MQMNLDIMTTTKSGKTYISFQGVNTEDFGEGTSTWQMLLFADAICTEEAEQDAHFLL